MEGWGGRFIIGEARALYLGPARHTTLHAHHAVQVCIGIHSSFWLRGARAAEWRKYRGAVIRADQAHELDGGGRTLLLLYVDPEISAGRRLTVLCKTEPIWPIPDPLVDRIVACLGDWQQGGQDEGALSGEIMEILAPGPTTVELDRRIAQALILLRAAPGRRLRLAELAAAVDLSATRLAHLFRAQVGLPVRRYLLWLRLGDALRELTQGASATAAAHAAGFADSAHLARTCRRMFGIVPSSLRAA